MKGTPAMKKILALALALAAVCGCAYRCEMQQGELVPEVPEYIFSNGLLEMRVVPAVAGRINGLTYLPTGLKLFEPMTYEVRKHDLLPPVIVSKVTGGRELIWGVGNFFNERMEVDKTAPGPEWAGIAMHGRYFQGENLDAVKKVTFEAGTLKVDIEFTIINRERKPKPVSLWKHLTAQLTPDKKDIILIPARSGAARVCGAAVLEVAEDSIFHDLDQAHQAAFFAPLAPWIGRCASDGVNRGTLVMSCDEMMLPDSRFYCWKDPARKLHTAEMVIAPHNLAPNAGHVYNFSYYYFPHLRSMRALSGDTGIDLEPNAMVLETAVATPPRTLELWIKRGDEFQSLGTHSIPAMKPGEPHRIMPLFVSSMRFDHKNDVIKGKWNDGTTFLLPVIANKGK